MSSCGNFANGGPAAVARLRRPDMDVQPGDVAEEIRRLQRCINDLVSLFALPAMWSGGEPSQIVDTLLDALLRMLQLDLVYVRLRDSGGQAPIEMVRFAPSQERTAQERTAQERTAQERTAQERTAQERTAEEGTGQEWT